MATASDAAARRRVAALVRHVGHTVTGAEEEAKAAVDAAATAWVMTNIVPVAGLSTDGSLKGKTLFITGASRGIGLAIAVRAARDGANIVIAAKTDQPHPNLPGTIHTAAEEIRKAGGRALAIQCDVRSEEQVTAAVHQAVETFGGIDILVNNASAISLTPVDKTDMKRYDLMHSVNIRGTFLCSKVCLPYLRRSKSAHILNISPPLNMEARWFAGSVGYTMSKFGMSMCALGMAKEFEDDGICVNTLWPRTVVATSAVKNLLGGDPAMAVSRSPEIMADAAHVVLTSRVSGKQLVDDEVLVSAGVSDLSKYSMDPKLPQHELGPDFFV